MSQVLSSDKRVDGHSLVDADGGVTLRQEELHAAVGDPQMDSMRLLSETAARYPGAVSFSSGAPSDVNHDPTALAGHLDRYLTYLRENGVPPARINQMMFQYGPVNGFIQPDVAKMLQRDERIEVPTEAIMITNGCQEAMLIALRGLFASPDDVLLTVSPAYVGILGAARMLDITLKGVAEGPDGLDPEAVSSAIRDVRAEGKRPVALYLVPEFANPTGAVVSMSNRQRLLELAATEGFLILEDNPYGLFAPDGAAMPTLKSLDRTRSVIYLGSFAKSAFPGARLGYLVADQPVAGPGGSVRLLAQELAKPKSMFTVGTSSLSQAVIGGILVKHDHGLRTPMRALAEAYLERLTTVLEGLAQHFPPDRYAEHRVRWNIPTGGFFLMVEVDFVADLAALERSALEFQVSWAPMSMFYVDGGGDRVIRLGFSSLEPDQIREGLSRLARFITAQTGAARACAEADSP
jgi:(S)-3,5-dihydroxyphenylglycine transaminase